jgi:hypothetical protein
MEREVRLTDRSAWEANVLAFVRGEEGAPSAVDLGLRVGPWARGRYAVPEGLTREPVRITVTDLSVGLERHVSSSPGDKEWAFVVLAADFIDFALISDHPEGDRLIGQLWDLSPDPR